jgi:hypothetical protein
MDKQFDLLNQGYAITVKVTIDGRKYGCFRRYPKELSKEVTLAVCEEMMSETIKEITEGEDAKND